MLLMCTLPELAVAPGYFDTGSVANICNSKQGLQIKRTLAKDEVTMHVGNGSKVYVIVAARYLYIYRQD